MTGSGEAIDPGATDTGRSSPAPLQVHRRVHNARLRCKGAGESVRPIIAVLELIYLTGQNEVSLT